MFMETSILNCFHQYAKIMRGILWHFYVAVLINCYLEIHEGVYCLQIELLNADINERGHLSCGKFDGQ